MNQIRERMNAGCFRKGKRVTTEPMRKDICCQNFKGLVGYVRKHYGESGVEKLTHGLLDGSYYVEDKFDPSRVVPVSETHLVDPAYWVSNAFSLQLLHNVNDVVQGPTPLYTAGAEMIREDLSRTTLFFARIIGIRPLVHRVPRINRRFNKTKDVRLVSFDGEKAVFELHYKPGFEVTKDVCQWNLGIYSGIAELAGLTRIRCRETACVLDGANCCRIVIEWKKRPLLVRLYGLPIAWMQRWFFKDLVADYEALLDERDSLIDSLSLSEKKYRTIFEDSLEALSLTQNGVFVDVNAAWLKLHGISEKQDAVGKAVVQVVHPDDRPRMSERLKKGFEATKRVSRMRDITQAGDTIHVEVYSSCIDYDGRESILAMVRDITAQLQAEEKRRLLEARLKQVEKMETMATLAGGVAHDLNNILSGIVGYPELIISRLPEDSPLRRPLNTMHATAKKAAAIVQDLLTLSRGSVMEMKAFNLNHVIEDYLQSPECEKMLSFHPGVYITTTLRADLMNMKGSALHVFKCIMNLVSNAAEAMHRGGVVTIGTYNQYVDRSVRSDDVMPEGEYVVLTVADQGVGISAADRERIFEPFYTKKKLGRSGTGLGMAVVWGTVQDHNGFIDVESRIGMGTTVEIHFPATRETLAAQEAEIAQSAMARGNGEKILVVDDLLEQREIAVDMLESLNYRTIAVESGEAALAHLASHAYDLILLDMIMSPGMDGLETYRRILEKHPGQKAILVSGYSDTESVKSALALGAGQCVRKPYSLQTIGAAIRSELDRGRNS